MDVRGSVVALFSSTGCTEVEQMSSINLSRIASTRSVYTVLRDARGNIVAADDTSGRAVDGSVAGREQEAHATCRLAHSEEHGYSVEGVKWER